MAGRYVDWYAKERRQDWTTPRAFFNELHQEFGFTLDGASSNDNGLLPRTSTPDRPVPWTNERVFCNPPWSNIPPFVELAATSKAAVLLVPARTNCKWFHRALELGAEVRFFLGKLKFGSAKWNSPVDCLLLIWGSGLVGPRQGVTPKEVKVINGIGRCPACQHLDVLHSAGIDETEFCGWEDCQCLDREIPYED